MIFTVDGCEASARGEGEGLVDGVNFVADVATDGDGHEDDLGVETCVLGGCQEFVGWERVSGNGNSARRDWDMNTM